MGLDLTIVPVHPHRWVLFDGEPGSILAYDRLGFQKDYALFSMITPIMEYPGPIIKPTPLPDGVVVQWYDDEGLKEITEDKYGARLTWVRAEEFNKMLFDETETSEHNKAIIRFLWSLPGDTPVVLFWH